MTDIIRKYWEDGSYVVICKKGTVCNVIDFFLDLTPVIAFSIKEEK